MFFRASLTPVAALIASASLRAQQTILPPPVFETIVNGDFLLPIIGQGARKEAADPVTWDYWAGIPGWSAYYGKNIELQTLWANPLPTPVGSAQYCE